jgi:hypothetical protein
MARRPRAPPDNARLLAAFARMKEVLERRNKCRTYSTEYKKYCRWVDSNNLRQAGDEVNFIHRDAIDSYFTREVVNRGGQMNNINRICSSIQWFHDNVEQPGGTADPAFVLRNNIVKAAIAQQQENWKNRGSTIHLGSDPHKGLKDLMPLGDKLIVARNIHRRADWGSLGMSFSWGCNAGVRGASSRKFVYADLNVSHGFGPEKTGPRSRCLLLVLRKGDAHKDRCDTDKQVGVWRHKNYLLCSVFNTALHIVNELRQDATINFYHYRKEERASWWDKELIQYNASGKESAAMTQVYRETGVESYKMTHNRTHAVQLGGSEGLAPWQLNTFTKHMLDKLNSAYQPEMNRETAKVMAAFEKDEPYFHGSSNLQHPVPVPTLINFLLPNYASWVRQANSVVGDKSICCRKFLHEVIPYLVEVLVQDGIYLIREFPNHPMSQYLKVCQPTLFAFCVPIYIYLSLLNPLFLRPESSRRLRAVGSWCACQGRGST